MTAKSKQDAAVYKAMEKNIKEYGRQIIAVAGDRKTKPFFYTIGNHNHNVPELLVIGNFNPNQICQLLNRTK